MQTYLESEKSFRKKYLSWIGAGLTFIGLVATVPNFDYAKKLVSNYSADYFNKKQEETYQRLNNGLKETKLITAKRGTTYWEEVVKNYNEDDLSKLLKEGINKQILVQFTEEMNNYRPMRAEENYIIPTKFDFD